MPPDDAGMASLLDHDLRAAISDIIGGLRLISHAGLDDADPLRNWNASARQARPSRGSCRMGWNWSPGAMPPVVAATCRSTVSSMIWKCAGPGARAKKG